ncbi:MAG: hypothetical protein KAT79_04090 [candidate division Zixibacteria bacterium]|nr:hypothetical protein [candidate division Zixibacteria bacterium]
MDSEYVVSRQQLFFDKKISSAVGLPSEVFDRRNFGDFEGLLTSSRLFACEENA